MSAILVRRNLIFCMRFCLTMDNIASITIAGCLYQGLPLSHLVTAHLDFQLYTPQLSCGLLVVKIVVSITMRRYEFTNDQESLIEDSFPGSTARQGRPWRSNRQVFKGIFWGLLSCAVGVISNTNPNNNSHKQLNAQV